MGRAGGGATVRAATASVADPRVRLEAPGPLDEVDARLPGGRRADGVESGHLMATDLRASNPAAPDGCAVAVSDGQGVVRVRVHDVTGAVAARGRVAIVGGFAVVDRSAPRRRTAAAGWAAR